ncbi:MAG: SDR family oxidoreductase [Hyphomicrobiaceae bacterium]|nr:SDR family oxidoreductase [Hyphomicrobiaceae bacterium]
MDLKNKVTIITGAARGIGFACAERFIADGAKVVLADINEKGGENAAEQLSGSGEPPIFVECDVGERLDVHNLVAETVDAHGRVDVLVNNAAQLDSAAFLELEEEQFDAVLKTNLKGPFLVGQAVARQMVAQVENGGTPGVIINMSSVNAVFALPDHLAYTVAKGGLSQLTKAMALALAPNGIRVNAIGPGSIMTEMLEKVATDEDVSNRILSRTPIGRFGEPSEVAAIAAFLASEESSYITGTTIYADGGRLALNYTVDVRSKD